MSDISVIKNTKSNKQKKKIPPKKKTIQEWLQPDRVAD